MRPPVAALSGLVAVALSTLAPLAGAHQLGLSKGTYEVRGASVDVEIVVQNGELAATVPAADTDHDGTLARGEIEGAAPSLHDVVTAPLVVEADGIPCVVTRGAVTVVEGDGVALRASYACKGPATRVVRIDAAFVPKLSEGHRHLATLRDAARSVDGVIRKGHTALELGRDGDPKPSEAAPSGFGALFLLGVEHILTGYDHLVFLAGLVLVGGRARALALVVTAFTLAHSITLGLAALHVFSPPSRFVEPAIALSIAYVGVENFFVKNAEKRWRITFPFGLIHGFGFAGALAEISLPRTEVPKALLAFNLGVEAGQLGVLAILLPLLGLLAKVRGFDPLGKKVASAAIVVAGAVWFVLRVVAGLRPSLPRKAERLLRRRHRRHDPERATRLAPLALCAGHALAAALRVALAGFVLLLRGHTLPLVAAEPALAPQTETGLAGLPRFAGLALPVSAMAPRTARLVVCTCLAHREALRAPASVAEPGAGWMSRVDVRLKGVDRQGIHRDAARAFVAGGGATARGRRTEAGAMERALAFERRAAHRSHLSRPAEEILTGRRERRREGERGDPVAPLELLLHGGFARRERAVVDGDGASEERSRDVAKAFALKPGNLRRLAAGGPTLRGLAVDDATETECRRMGRPRQRRVHGLDLIVGRRGLRRAGGRRGRRSAREGLFVRAAARTLASVGQRDREPEEDREAAGRGPRFRSRRRGGAEAVHGSPVLPQRRDRVTPKRAVTRWRKRSRTRRHASVLRPSPPRVSRRRLRVRRRAIVG